jgi:hypothetical protein
MGVRGWGSAKDVILKGIAGRENVGRFEDGKVGMLEAWGLPHSRCFLQRVHKQMKRLEIAFFSAQKSAQEYENKGKLKHCG